MKIRTALLLFFLVSVMAMNAQDRSENEIRVIQDDRIDTLLSKYAEINAIDPGIKGWRIEIFFEAGNYSKMQAMEAKSKFVEKYPEISCYLIFQQPYYKVRIGDYRTKMDAEKILDEIELDYPNAFVVVDDINFPRLD